MKWISVKDRLPEDWQEVIVYSPDEDVQSGVFYSKISGFQNDCNGRTILVNITHWMPLPELPSHAE
jgi:hypothetical protein